MIPTEQVLEVYSTSQITWDSLSLKFHVVHSRLNIVPVIKVMYTNIYSIRSFVFCRVTST